jgi:hypothetical protein
MFAGCVQSEGATAPAPAASAGPNARPAEFDETTGGVEGVVHDENIIPVPNAQIALAGTEHMTVSDSNGRFSFSKVPVGRHTLFASALGFQSTGKSIDIVAGQVTPVDVLLVVLPIVEPFYEIKTQAGLFGCGISWRPAVVYSGVAVCGVAEGTQFDDFLLVWETTGPPTAWVAGVFETVWSSNQAFGAGLSINWEPNGCSNNAPTRFARTAGHSPLWGRLAGEEFQEKMKNVTTSSCSSDECNEEKCNLQTRAFSYPDTLGASAPADIGITFQQVFHQFLTEFYHDEGPEDFSAVADG